MPLTDAIAGHRAASVARASVTSATGAHRRPDVSPRRSIRPDRRHVETRTLMGELMGESHGGSCGPEAGRDMLR